MASVMPMHQDFNLQIIIDGTGVSSLFGIFLEDSVYKQVNRFLNLTWDGMGGDPPLLKIFWGQFTFVCTLQEVNINYTLFDQTGMPLRAELNATFKSKYLNNQGTSKPNENKSNNDNTNKVENGIVINVS
jgi:hypothetical protein